MKKTLILIFFITLNTYVFAQSMSVSPGWSVTIPASTITEAGLNYTTNQTSSASQSLIDVTGGLISNTKIFVQKTDILWNSNLTLWIKRTGPGSGLLTGISGGDIFQQITNTTSLFFSVAGILTARSNIPIQYEIRGLSVLIPAQSYTTTLVFTVSN